MTDTFADINGEDSLVIRQATRYIPDDVLLTWFNEDYKAQYLQDHSRTDRRILSIGMAAPADSLPVLTVISACGDTTRRIPLDKSSMLSRSATNDTLNYWLTDTALINCDSLLVETRYRRTDTLQELAWATDTLKFFMKRARGKKAREAEARRHVRTFRKSGLRACHIGHNRNRHICVDAAGLLAVVHNTRIRLAGYSQTDVFFL